MLPPDSLAAGFGAADPLAADDFSSPNLTPPLGAKSRLVSNLGLPVEDMYYNPVLASPDFDPSIFPEATGDPSMGAAAESTQGSLEGSLSGSMPPRGNDAERAQAAEMLSMRARDRQANSEKFQEFAASTNKQPTGY